MKVRPTASPPRRSAGRIPPAVVCGVVAVALLLSGCDRGEDQLLSELERIEQGSGYTDEGPSQERIQELKSDIEKYRSVVEEKVEASGKLGVYHKMLAVAYMDRKMYGLALDHLERAIEIQPENPILFYYAGVSAARLAKSEVEEGRKNELLSDAEQYYLRSVELDPRYGEANYALAVLYLFELDRPVAAREYLNRVMEDEPRNDRAYMMLARSYAATGEVQRAAELYDEAAELTKNDELREAALRNRQELVEGRSQ
ncbi:MAG: tetratricopeptide repeat protein [Spirochaetes bacterium]|jgi:tetratricopeptide (TPR) repeat protein|nr:tetratricopeptide repeat protein [Spirochaetota bacterium]